MGRYKPHILLIAVIVLFQVIPETIIEQYYSNLLYPKIHSVLYWIFGYLPFPGYYLVLAVVFLYIFKWIITLVSGRSIIDKIVRITGQLSKWVIWYFVLWGFNYGRIPLEEKLKLTIRPLTSLELVNEIDTVSKELAAIRLQMEQDTVPIHEGHFDYAKSVNDKLSYTLHQWEYRSVRVKGRELFTDILLRFDVGGQYMPYTGEANIDKGVHYYSKPFYMLHEMCHANGFCDEASCNFMAYVVCTNFSENGFHYSAKINYMKYMLGDLYAIDSTQCISIMNDFPVQLRYDIALLKKHAQEHTFRTSVIGEAINNVYLKLMGIPEGIRSYNKMILLVYAWRHKQYRRFD